MLIIEDFTMTEMQNNKTKANFEDINGVTRSLKSKNAYNTMDYKEKRQGITNDLQNNLTGLYNRQLKLKLN